MWSYFVCEVTTGNVVDQIDLSGFNGAQSISSDGQLSADVPVGQLDTGRVRDIFNQTAPGRYSIVADRNGTAVGEWIIWKRQRSTSAPVIQIVGTEFLSYFAHREMPQSSFVGVDQLVVAQTLLQAGLNGNGTGKGAVAMTVNAGASGISVVQDYLAGESTILQRVQDIANAEQGFEFVMNVAWSTSGTKRVVRTVNMGYPRLGITQDAVFELAESGAVGGSAQSMTIVEDGTLLASKVWALGAGTGVTQVIGIAENTALLDQGYPLLEATKSWSNDARQDIINGFAKGLLNISQSSETPPAVTVLMDSDPVFGSYALGDVMNFKVGVQAAFPDGWVYPARILGWTIAPPTAGIETTQLNITAAYAGLGGF